MLGVKKMKIKDIVREEILHSEIFEIKTVFPEEYIRLNMNENFFIERDVIQRIVQDACKEVDLRLYPPNLGAFAVSALSEFLGIDESMIYVGNGLDNVMEVFFRTFLRRGREVITIEPTFTVYSYFTRLSGGKVRRVLLNPDFSLNLDEISKAMNKDVSIIVVCSPNNPTGNQFPEKDIEEILKLDALVVLDEAYVHFAEYSMIDKLKSYDNLVIMRTFSKVFGLAGVRFGYLLSQPEVIDFMKRATHPFHMNYLTQLVIANALKMWSYFDERSKLLIKEREWLQSKLSKLEGIKPYPSKTNFILIRLLKDNLTPQLVCKKLRERKILIRDVSDRALLSDCIRVTVGTREQNETFLSAFEDVLKS